MSPGASARALALMGSGDPRQVDEALSLIDLNLKENPSSFEDQRSRAIVLSLKPGRHDEAIGTLEDLQKTGLLSKQDRFLLARLHAKPRLVAVPQPDVRAAFGPRSGGRPCRLLREPTDRSQ